MCLVLEDAGAGWSVVKLESVRTEKGVGGNFPTILTLL